jgi:hypothetical protein
MGAAAVGFGDEWPVQVVIAGVYIKYLLSKDENKFSSWLAIRKIYSSESGSSSSSSGGSGTMGMIGLAGCGTGLTTWGGLFVKKRGQVSTFDI